MYSIRANYQAMIWKQADIAQPDIPDLEGHGWKKDANDVLTIEWCEYLVPQQLADILTEEQSTEQESDDEDIITEIEAISDGQDSATASSSSEEVL